MEPPEDLPLTLDEQVKCTLSNLRRCLVSIGAGPHDVLKITQYVVGYNHIERGWTRHFEEFFDGNPPTSNIVPGELDCASSHVAYVDWLVVVQSLAWPGWLYDVDAIAIVRP